MKILSTFLLIAAALSLIMSEPVLAAENLAKNPSFEETSEGMPLSWNTDAFEKSAGTTTFSIEASGSHSGANCAVIANSSVNDARYIQSISVKENTNYKITCWIKTENVGADNKGANISIKGNIATSADLKGTDNMWKSVSLYVEAGENISAMDLCLCLGGYSSMNSGKAYFDDISVEETAEIPEGSSIVKLNNIENDKKTDTANSNYSSGDSSKSNGFILLILFGIAAFIIVAFVAFSGRKKDVGTDSSTTYDLIDDDNTTNNITTESSKHFDDEDLI